MVDYENFASTIRVGITNLYDVGGIVHKATVTKRFEISIRNNKFVNRAGTQAPLRNNNQNDLSKLPWVLMDPVP